MCEIYEVIHAIYVDNVNVVVIAPARGPGLNHHEGVAAILKMRLAADDLRMADVERMFAAKVRTEFVVGNTSALGLFRLGVLVSWRRGFAVFGTRLLFRLIRLDLWDSSGALPSWAALWVAL